MPVKELGTKRYSPTKVRREVFNSSGDHYGWQEVEMFEDATVRDNGDDGITNSPQAMLRAYSNDPDFFGDEDYQQGNGIHVCKDGEYYGESMKGYVMDCDGDIALKRIMGLVLNKLSHGHGQEYWTVAVGFDDEDGEFNGWGKSGNMRVERWTVSIAKEDQNASG